MLTFALAGCTRTAPSSALSAQVVRGVRITLNTVPPPHVGDNALQITLADATTGAPIGNANLTATATMISPRILGSSSSGRAQGNGAYQLPVRFGIATRYELNLHVQRPGQPGIDAVIPVDAVQ